LELTCPANLIQLSFWDQYKGKGQYCVGNLLGITKATLLATRLIFQTLAKGATISWLFLAHLDCYLHGQAFLILQHKTLAFLAAQQSLDIALSIAIE
jgi:hypothetical protein